MATQSHYVAFKDVYDDEIDRSKDLTATGRIYLTVASFFLGGAAFQASDQLASINSLAQTLLGAALLLLGIAFVLVVISLFVFTYESTFDPLELLESEDGLLEDDAFLEDRVVDLAVATQRNFEINDNRAKLLKVASATLLAGVLVALVVFAVTVFYPQSLSIEQPNHGNPESSTQIKEKSSD